MPAVSSNIDWAKSMAQSFRLREMDVEAWQPGAEVPGVVEANVSRDFDGSILESGGVTVHAPLDFEPREFWGRLELLAEQGGAIERWPVATLLMVPNEVQIAKGRKIVPYDCSSVLKAAADTVLPVGYCVAPGADGAEAVAAILSEALPCPVRAEGSFRLSEGLVLSRGTSRLEAAWRLVDAAGWCMQIDGEGAVTVRPKPVQPSLVLDTSTSSLLGTEVRSNPGAAGLPNVYVAVEGVTVARAELPGIARAVEQFDGTPNRLGGETLQAYAERRLAEMNEVVGTRSYRRSWVPGLTVYDVIDGKLGEAGLDARMRIRSQHVVLGGDLMVDEEVDVI